MRLKIEYKASESAFSLVEMMIGMLVLLIIMGSVFSALTNSQRVYDAELANAQAQENARYAVQRIAEIVQTAGNNPQNITSINGLAFIRLYNISSFTPSMAATMPPSVTIPPSCSGTSCPTGKQLQLLSDFDGDAQVTSDVGMLAATSSIFTENVITGENILIYLDPNTNLVSIYNFTPNPGAPLPGGGTAPPQGSTLRAVPIAEFVTDLSFTVDSTQNQVTVRVTARSNRAVSIENVYQKRFRYAHLVSVVHLRNR